MIESIGKRSVPAYKKIVEIEVAGNTLDGTDVIMPSVRYALSWCIIYEFNIYNCGFLIVMHYLLIINDLLFLIFTIWKDIINY